MGRGATSGLERDAWFLTMTPRERRWRGVYESALARREGDVPPSETCGGPMVLVGHPQPQRGIRNDGMTTVIFVDSKRSRHALIKRAATASVESPQFLPVHLPDFADHARIERGEPLPRARDNCFQILFNIVRILHSPHGKHP